MDTTPALNAALSAERVIFFVGMQLDLPNGGAVRLLDGNSEVTWSQGTFRGVDATWGTLENIEAIGDGLDEQAPTLSMTLFPDASADVATICNPALQGSRTRIWLGALNLTTKAVVADPYLMFDGAVDIPTVISDEGARAVDFEVASQFEKLFMDDEGSRLNPNNHKDVWPGETGLDQITGIVRQVIWGPGDKITGAMPGSVGTPMTSISSGNAAIGSALINWFSR